MNSRYVLLIEKQPQCTQPLSLALQEAGFQVTVTKSLPEAFRELCRVMSDAVVCDLFSGLPVCGYEVVTATRARGATIRCIVAAESYGEVESLVLSGGFELLAREAFPPQVES